MPILDTIVFEFEEWCKKKPGPIPWSFYAGDLSSKRLFVVFCGIHGNEVGSIPGVLAAAKKIEENGSKEKLLFVLGNPDAVRIQKRFVESDLNRLLTDNDELGRGTSEKRRALELKTAVQSASFVLDLHQTNRPSLYPFFIFTENTEALNFAKRLGEIFHWVVDLPLTSGERSVDQYAKTLGIPAVVAELGLAGLNEEAASLASRLILRCADWSEAREESVLQVVKIVEQIPFVGPGDFLIDGFENFQRVLKGQTLGYRGNKEPISAPIDGAVLFPKYPPRDGKGQILKGQMPRQMCSIAIPT